MCTARLLTVSQHALFRVCVYPSMHCLGGGEPAREVYLPRGCTCPGVYLLGGSVPAREGVPSQGCTFPGGVPAGGGTCPGTSPCEQNDRQVQKYDLAPNFVCGR